MTTKKKVTIAIVGGIPLICLLGSFALLRASFGKAAAGHDAELDAAKKDGIPLEPADLAAMVRVPDSENAAPLYQKILPIIHEQGPLTKQFSAISSGFGHRAKPADIEKAYAALPAMRDVLAKAREATKLPHCDFKRNWGLGPNVLFPEMSGMKNLARALAFEAKARAQTGDLNGALEDLTAAQKIGRHVGEDPNIIGLLVQVSIESIVQSALDEIIDKHKSDAHFLAAAKKMHDAFGPLPNFRYALGGEVVMGRVALRMIKSHADFSMQDFSSSGEESKTPRAFPGEEIIFSSPTVKDAFDMKLVHAYRMMYENASPDPDKWEITEKASKEAESQIDADHSISNMPSRVLAPVFSGVPGAIGRMIAHRHLTDTEIRLLLDQTRTGSLPSKLPNYGLSTMDPFSGKPLAYKPSKHGFLLYSFGPDRTDDGGKPSWEDHSGTGSDEVVEVH